MASKSDKKSSAGADMKTQIQRQFDIIDSLLARWRPSAMKTLPALDRVLRLLDQRLKLLGLSARLKPQAAAETAAEAKAPLPVITPGMGDKEAERAWEQIRDQDGRGSAYRYFGEMDKKAAAAAAEDFQSLREQFYALVEAEDSKSPNNESAEKEADST